MDELFKVINWRLDAIDAEMRRLHDRLDKRDAERKQEQADAKRGRQWIFTAVALSAGCVVGALTLILQLTGTL